MHKPYNYEFLLSGMLAPPLPLGTQTPPPPHLRSSALVLSTWNASSKSPWFAFCTWGLSDHVVAGHMASWLYLYDSIRWGRQSAGGWSKRETMTQSPEVGETSVMALGQRKNV